jgi:hypothetical protein
MKFSTHLYPVVVIIIIIIIIIIGKTALGEL